jgi:hypothetical protein
MNRGLFLPVVGWLLILVNSSSYAIPVQVDFSFDLSGAPAASGSFTYDNSLQGGIVSYGDLSAFNLTLPTASFDLTFVTSGPFAFNYMAFDTNSAAFLPNAADSTILAAVTGLEGFLLFSDLFSDSGFALSIDDNAISLWDHSSVSVRVAAVPEPPMLSLVALGLSLIGFGWYRRKVLRT